MSFEFATRIQNLTNKLQSLTQSSPKQVMIEDVKEQLTNLQAFLNRQLIKSQKRISKMQIRLSQRTQSAIRQEQSMQIIWNGSQQKVTQIIGNWLQEYEKKSDEAKTQLERQQQLARIKLQQEQNNVGKEIRTLEMRISDQMNTLQREINKWNNINQQQTASIYKEIKNSSINLTQSILKSQQTSEQQTIQLYKRAKLLKQMMSSKRNQLQQQIIKRTAKYKQVIQLLLQID